MKSFPSTLSIYAAALASLAPLSVASILPPRQSNNSPWSVANFNALLTFGDSYTDESRLAWFVTHNGSAPPTGAFLPESFSTAGGGRTWARYVVQYTGATMGQTWTPQMTLYDYAVAGAVCSNEVTPRWLPLIDAPYPSVLEYEVPAFEADLGAMRFNSTPSEQLFTPSLSAQSAVYALWIGTNDLGVWAFLTASQIRGKVLGDYTDCVYAVFDKLYANGGRVFVLMNTAPLNLAPLYANDTLHGVGPNEYWPKKPSNHTQIAETMLEYTTSVNKVFQYQTPFEVLVAKRYPDAHFAIFDTHSLISDIYHSPRKYLNGTGVSPGGEAVWGFEHHCNVNQTECTLRYNGTNPDGFLWYDELHPSEQTDRVIARNFVDVLNGTSKYATYY